MAADPVIEEDLSGVSVGLHAEAAKCPYCSGESRLLVSSTDYNRGTTDERFRYFQCEACGLVFLTPLPKDLRPYYEGGYAAIPDSLAGLRAIASEEKYRLEPVLRYKQRGRLLEIGPWRGVFCVNAKDAGFEVSAIEMDAQCVDFLVGEVGVRAIQSTDPAATMAAIDEEFDVIALWHSLEHMARPWEVLEQASGRLAPGGILLVAIPNIESFEFKVLKERWRHLDAPRHLSFYPLSSLEALCAGFGMDLVEQTTEDHLSELLALDTWKTAMDRWVGVHFYTTSLIRLARRWARRRERKSEGSGAGLTAVFQKRG